MNCVYCGQPIKQYGSLSYCDKCKQWYKGDKEEDGVYYYCKIKDENPDKCDSFIQNQIIIRSTKKRNGEPLFEDSPDIDKIRIADKICAACENKNFVLNG